MAEFIAYLINTIVWLTFSKICASDLEREIILLRKENQILKRKCRRIRYSTLDRMFFVALLKVRRELLAKLTVIKPSTVIGWHRKLVARKWTYASRRVGRPAINEGIKALIVEMKRDNPQGSSDLF